MKTNLVKSVIRFRSVSRCSRRFFDMGMQPDAPTFVPTSVVPVVQVVHDSWASQGRRYRSHLSRAWRVPFSQPSNVSKPTPVNVTAHTHAHQEPQIPQDLPLSPHVSSAQQKVPKHPAKSGNPRLLRKGDEVTVTITRIGYGGSCVGQLNGPLDLGENYKAETLSADDFSLPIYCPPGACPGDVVQCVITRVRRRSTHPDGISPPPPPGSMEGQTPVRSYAEALYTSLLETSPDSLTPVCSHFGHHKLGGGGCGGCTMLHVPYNVQLEQKDAQLRTIFTALRRNGMDIQLQPMLPCQDTLQFRNKMEFTFGRRWVISSRLSGDEWSGLRDAQGRPVALGLYAPQRYDKVVNISQCHIQPAICNEILDEVRAAAIEMLLEPYDTVSKTGYLRSIAIRSATNAQGGQEIMVNIITSQCDVPKRLVPLGHRLMERFPEIVCVVQNIRGIHGQHVVEENHERLLAGTRAYIHQKLCGLTFRISANSFFQTNARQAEVLYEQVRKMAQLKPTDSVLDFYCGTGTIGLSLAKQVHAIYGVDVTEAAIRDALVNSQLNEIINAHFLQLNLDKLKSVDKSIFPNADVIVVDPPRSGLHPDVVKFIATSNARRILYVSCNPLTQVRDILQLLQLAPTKFTLVGVQPVDMFPNSHHVECVAALQNNYQEY